jgi:hypothetical protein
MRGVSELSRSKLSGGGSSFITCVCGRIVEPTEAGVKPHRPRHAVKDGVPMTRKARKASWCEAPAPVKAAVVVPPTVTEPPTEPATAPEPTTEPTEPKTAPEPVTEPPTASN